MARNVGLKLFHSRKDLHQLQTELNDCKDASDELRLQEWTTSVEACLLSEEPAMGANVVPPQPWQHKHISFADSVELQPERQQQWVKCQSQKLSHVRKLHKFRKDTDKE